MRFAPGRLIMHRNVRHGRIGWVRAARVVRPDLSWAWKDEEEFAERLALPEHYWVTDEKAVRAEGERVIRLAEAGKFPFDGTWCDFTPPVDWGVPDELPPGWDRPPVR